jgi:hypothetical protein
MASINLSSFAGAGAQFFDDNGTPLVGGLLYVYAAGTTTPATTYTDPSGTVSNTNPIVLDAGGRTPYEIWVNGGVLYKFVLKTSTGVTIGTYDSIPAIDDPTAFNNIITVTGTNTLIGTSTPSNTAYTRGMTLSFVVVNTNTGAVTIDVDGLGAKEITFSGSTPLIAGQLTAGALVTIEYDGTRFQLMNSSGALAITASSINGGQIAGFRNRIINGAMVVAQRGTASVNTNAAFPVDRFYQVMSTGVIASQQSSTAPTGFINSIASSVTTADSTLGATSQYGIRQIIEGSNLQDLSWGTANAVTVTLSFWVRSSLTGTYCVSLRNSAANRSYPATYTINVANTWEKKTITVPGDTSGTWLTTNGIGVYCQWSLGADPAYNGSANAWQSGSYVQTSAQTAWISTLGATFYITGVQLELGSTATPFEQRLYGPELALCQRYYQSQNDIVSLGVYTTNLGQSEFLRFLVQMRSSPTTTVTPSGFTNVGYTSTSSVTGTVSGVRFVFNTSTAVNTIGAGSVSWTASAEL